MPYTGANFVLPRYFPPFELAYLERGLASEYKWIKSWVNKYLGAYHTDGLLATSFVTIVSFIWMAAQCRILLI